MRATGPGQHAALAELSPAAGDKAVVARRGSGAGGRSAFLCSGLLLGLVPGSGWFAAADLDGGFVVYDGAVLAGDLGWHHERLTDVSFDLLCDPLDVAFDASFQVLDHGGRLDRGAEVLGGGEQRAGAGGEGEFEA